MVRYKSDEGEALRLAFRSSLLLHIEGVRSPPERRAHLADVGARLRDLLQHTPMAGDSVGEIERRAFIASQLDAVLLELITEA